MRSLEHYRKYKTHYPASQHPFSREHWLRTVIILFAAVLIWPLFLYKYYRNIVPFTSTYYLTQVTYGLCSAFLISGFYFRNSWRETVKRNRSYCLVGKFEVVSKRSSFVRCYLLLVPGQKNEIGVTRNLFNKVEVGDSVVVRRDALGVVEKVIKVKKFATKLVRSRAMK